MAHHLCKYIFLDCKINCCSFSRSTSLCHKAIAKKNLESWQSSFQIFFVSKGWFKIVNSIFSCGRSVFPLKIFNSISHFLILKIWCLKEINSILLCPSVLIEKLAKKFPRCLQEMCNVDFLDTPSGPLLLPPARAAGPHGLCMPPNMKGKLLQLSTP